MCMSTPYKRCSYELLFIKIKTRMRFITIYINIICRYWAQSGIEKQGAMATVGCSSPFVRSSFFLPVIATKTFIRKLAHMYIGRCILVISSPLTVIFWNGDICITLCHTRFYKVKSNASHMYVKIKVKTYDRLH